MREKHSRRLYMLTMYLDNGLKVEFWDNAQVALDRHSPWLSLDEVDWVDLIAESVYGGPVYFKVIVEWVSDESTEQWKAEDDNDKISERDALYILKWQDIRYIRLVYKEPDED